jgi:hypothetical protein
MKRDAGNLSARQRLALPIIALEPTKTASHALKLGAAYVTRPGG